MARHERLRIQVPREAQARYSLKTMSPPSRRKEAPMSHRSLVSTVALAVGVVGALLAQKPAAGQTQPPTTKGPAAAKAWETARPPGGKPHLQGESTNHTFTPVERPQSLG